jgi:hypothetical protein
MRFLRNFLAAASVVCIGVAFAIAQQQAVQETTAPIGNPKAGFSLCWVDAATHINYCKNSAGTVFQKVPLDANGNLAVSFPGVAVLPPATGGTVRGIYIWTGATSPNKCPAAGAGGSGGSAIAVCTTFDGASWVSVLATDTSENLTLPGGITGAIVSVGTKPTITGCGTISAQAGGPLSGTFHSGATSCTPVLTALPATTTGYQCTISDQSLGTGVVLMNISSTTTSAAFPTITTTSGDTLAFQCGLSN